MRFSVSRTDNFVNVFDRVTSPPVLSYHCVLSYFLTKSVGFHFNWSASRQLGFLSLLCSFGIFVSLNLSGMPVN